MNKPNPERLIYPERLILMVLLCILAGTLMYKSLSMSNYSLPFSTKGQFDYTGAAGLSIQLYPNSSLIGNLTTLEWGQVPVGGQVSKTIYIKNTCVYVLNMPYFNTTQWNPTVAGTYLNMTWNYNDTTLNPNNVIPVTFTLKASAQTKDVTAFAFKAVLFLSQVS